MHAYIIKFGERIDNIKEKSYKSNIEISWRKIKYKYLSGWTDDLDTNLLSIDTNQQFDEEYDPTFFYNGVIPFDKIKIIK